MKWQYLVIVVVIVAYDLGKVTFPALMMCISAMVTTLYLEGGADTATAAGATACADTKTATACSCISRGDCGCLLAAFEKDPLWRAYKAAVCRGEQPSPGRLLHAYDVRDLPSLAGDPACVKTSEDILARIEGYTECAGAEDDVRLGSPEAAGLFEFSAPILDQSWYASLLAIIVICIAMLAKLS